MTWVVDGRTFARKVKNPTYGVHGHCGGGRSIECPSCGFVLDQINLAHHWPGLPAGVKFDPSDQELLEHLAAKLGLDCSKVHPFIDEFIPTLNEEDGICYTHPEKLPGVRYDGSSIHFFNRPARAYTTGTRKRRKVQSADDNGNGIEMRWHKTGKTRPVLKDGKQIGCKKIMVLYVSTGKKTKPDKTFWVMHQYHLGMDDDEKDEVSGQCEHVVLEASRQQAPSSHQSSPSTMSNSNTSYAAPSPKTPGPFLSDAVKQPKGLLATLTEDVDKLKSSLSSHSQNTVQTSDQGVMALGLNFVALDCKSASKVQESVSDLLHDSCRLGEMDTSCSGQEMVESEKGLEPIGMFSTSSFRTSLIELPAFEGHHISDVLDPYVLKLLSEENLNITLKLKGGDEVMRTSTNEAAENGGLRDETVQKVDSLDNIILDTPPDFLMESLPNSQELTEWLAKKKLWSDSSQRTEDGSFLDFLKDSQSSV